MLIFEELPYLTTFLSCSSVTTSLWCHVVFCQILSGNKWMSSNFQTNHPNQFTIEISFFLTLLKGNRLLEILQESVKTVQSFSNSTKNSGELHSLKPTAKARENRQRPKRKQSYSNHPFSGAKWLLVSGRVITLNRMVMQFLISKPWDSSSWWWVNYISSNFKNY